MRALPFLFAIALATPAARADDKPAPAATPGPAAVPAKPAPPPASLPLPSPSGKTLAAAPGQRIFRIPLGFARVERFYRELLGGDSKIAITVERGPSGRTLMLVSRRSTDAWSQAVAHEGAVDTTIEVTPIFRIGKVVDVTARAPQPLVHFIMPPSPEVMRQANSIDHLTPPK